MRRVSLLYIIADLFNVWVKRQWDSHVCFCIHSISICRFGWSTWRKSSLSQMRSWKREECFNSPFRKLRVVFLTSSSFLKVSCNVESETILMNFHSLFNRLYSITLKPTVLSCTLSGSLTRAWFCNILRWSFGKCQVNDLCRSSKCWHTSFHNIQNANLHLLITLPSPLEKSLSIGTLSRSLWQIQLLQNANFNSKTQILSLATSPVSCFPWSDRCTSFSLEKTSARYPSLSNHSFLVFQRFI